MNKGRFVIIILTALFNLMVSPDLLFAQEGTIHFSDSTTLDFFSLKTGELHFLDSDTYAANENYFSLNGIKEIEFRYDKRPSEVDFSYFLKMDAITEKHKKVRVRLSTWDWLEMKIPDQDHNQANRIIFFHSKKKYKIDKIVFQW